MNKEQLAKGKTLSEQISSLEDHVLYVENIVSNENKGTQESEFSIYPRLATYPLQLNVNSSWGSNNTLNLKTEFAELDTFLFEYLQRAKQKLAQLQNQFEAL